MILVCGKKRDLSVASRTPRLLARRSQLQCVVSTRIRVRRSGAHYPREGVASRGEAGHGLERIISHGTQASRTLKRLGRKRCPRCGVRCFGLEFCGVVRHLSLPCHRVRISIFVSSRSRAFVSLFLLPGPARYSKSIRRKQEESSSRDKRGRRCEKLD